MQIRIIERQKQIELEEKRFYVEKSNMTLRLKEGRCRSLCSGAKCRDRKNA